MEYLSRRRRKQRALLSVVVFPAKLVLFERGRGLPILFLCPNNMLFRMFANRLLCTIEFNNLLSTDGRVGPANEVLLLFWRAGASSGECLDPDHRDAWG